MIVDDLSPEAVRFLNAFEKDDTPIDFSRIQEFRAQTISDHASTAERAIERHAITRKDIAIAGIPCEHIRSARTETSTGTLVYLFGGGFIFGCPYSDLTIIGALAELCHVDVIAPKFSLSPEHPAPAAINDCMNVYREVAQSSVGRLLLGGESAGGNLALLVAQSAVNENIRVPDAMGLLSPDADLRPDSYLYEPNYTRDPTLSQSILADVLTAYLPGIDPKEPLVSPIFGDMRGLPPTIITTGTRDLLLAVCLRTARAMHRANVDVDTRVWNGFWHVFEYYDDYPESAESLSEIASFLNRKS
jgi:monoterpene epsilon-lactone hydrolase